MLRSHMCLEFFFLHCLVCQQGENTASRKKKKKVETEQQQTIGDETTVDGD